MYIIIGFSIQVLSALTLLILLVFLARNFIASKEIRILMKSIVTTIFVCNLSCVVTFLVIPMLWILEAKEELVNVLFCGSLISYIVGKMGVEVFFIVRAHATFKDSTLAVSRSTIWLSFAVTFILTLVWIYVMLNHTYNFNTVITAKATDCLILAVMDAGFMFCLLLLFTRKLGGLVVMQRRRTIAPPTTQGASNSKASGADTSTAIRSVQQHLDNHQTRLIAVITRAILLTVIAFSTTILVALGIYLVFITSVPEYTVVWLCSLDVVINSFCLYLNFVFAANLYQKCCGCCHARCQLLMEYHAASRIVQARNQSMVLQLSKHAADHVAAVVPDVTADNEKEC